MQFSYAIMWSIGGCVAEDKIANHRKSFNSLMKSLSKQIKFPEGGGEPMDYRFEPKLKEWVHWDQWVKDYTSEAFLRFDRAEVMYQNIVISNVDIERMKYILELHYTQSKPVLFVGVAGTGKTVICKSFLEDICTRHDDVMNQCINNNNYTTSAALQAILMSVLDKRTGRTFGPPQNKKCIYFIDDLNMPYVDTYDTQSAIMLLTQIFSYAELYNREALEEKISLVDIKFCACMNPKAGSFMTNLRLQRHFTVLTAFLPTAASISGIYSQILDKHLSRFTPAQYKLCQPIVEATIDTLIGNGGILSTPSFLPSSKKFHYQFNLKDVANIFQGLLNTEAGMFKNAGGLGMARTWIHEAMRVWSDRLIDVNDQKDLQVILEKVAQAKFQPFGMTVEDMFHKDVLVMTSFVSQALGNDRAYIHVKDMTQLKKSRGR
jgi:dynein heavy chain